MSSAEIFHSLNNFSKSIIRDSPLLNIQITLNPFILLIFNILGVFKFFLINPSVGSSHVMTESESQVELSNLKFSNSKDFIGHIGGDDFVVISSPEVIQNIGEEIIRLLDEGIGRFYSKEDHDSGFIVTKDRQGVVQKFPVVSISISVVNNLRHTFTNIGEIVKIVTELKKFAKQKEGSCLVIDKRG